MSPSAPYMGIVDYGMGNRRSVEKALHHVGARAILTSEPAALQAAAALVIPGVGAFPRGMAKLSARGLDRLVLERAQAGTPILGICLGMQLLFEGSDELASVPGLGLIPGWVTPLQAGGLRVPHIGWNEVRVERPSPLLDAAAAFYHVHSLVARPREPDDVVATADYGERFATVVSRGNVHGVQFHPEKSSRDGLALLRAFARLAGTTSERPAAVA